MKKVGVVAFGFGSRLTKSNGLIAEAAAEKAIELRAPVFTQTDVQIEIGIETKYFKQQPNRPPSTLQFVKAVVEWAIAENIGVICVVAAPPHRWRCVRDLRKIIRKSSAKIGVRVSKRTGNHKIAEWFCSNSEQLRTQFRILWWPRELILRIMPFWFYDFLTG